MDGNQNQGEPTNTQVPIDSQSTPTPESTPIEAATPKTEEATKPADAQPSFELNETTILSALAYLGPLVIVPYLIKKDNLFVMFHIKQGVLLLIPYLLLWVMGGMIYMLSGLISIINLVLIVLSIIGIVNAVQGKEKELPIIGKFASKINL